MNNNFHFGKQPLPEFRALLKSDGTLELTLYGEIVDAFSASLYEADGVTGFISAAAVKNELDAASQCSKIRVRINSPGGDAFEGVAIYNLLRAVGKPLETCVDGIAASSASIVAMAGEKRCVSSNAMLMIHNAWGVCMGSAAEMRKMSNVLDKISASIAQTYVDRTKLDFHRVKAMMDAETWLSADDCIANGFATEITNDAAEGSGSSAEALAMARARSFVARSLQSRK